MRPGSCAAACQLRGRGPVRTESWTGSSPRFSAASTRTCPWCKTFTASLLMASMPSLSGPHTPGPATAVVMTVIMPASSGSSMGTWPGSPNTSTPLMPSRCSLAAEYLKGARRTGRSIVGLYIGVCMGLYPMIRWPKFSPSVEGAAMPKINVYLPDDLAEAVKEAGLPVSAICQATLEQAVRRLTTIRQLVASDLDIDTLGSRLPRFPDKALPAFGLAAEQARAAGVPLVGTEHLLGGLLAEGSNLALAVLHAMDIETSAVKAELDRAAVGSHPGGPDAARRISGPLGTALVGA